MDAAVGGMNRQGWPKFCAGSWSPNEPLLEKSIHSFDNGTVVVLSSHEELYRRDVRRKGAAISLGREIFPARDDSRVWRPWIVNE